MTPAARDGEGGFSLIEVLVALGLFSLIAWAGFSVLDGVLRTQSRTDGRLERLAEVQRAMHLMTLDLEQATGEPLLHAGDALVVNRFDAGPGGPAVTVQYALADGALTRTVSTRTGARLASQTLIGGVGGLDWQFQELGGAWLPDWPPATKDAPVLPSAIAAQIEVASPDGGVSGTLRRVVRLPAGLAE